MAVSMGGFTELNGAESTPPRVRSILSIELRVSLGQEV